MILKTIIMEPSLVKLDKQILPFSCLSFLVYKYILNRYKTLLPYFVAGTLTGRDTKPLVVGTPVFFRGGPQLPQPRTSLALPVRPSTP